jgi:hypothetical protein
MPPTQLLCIQQEFGVSAEVKHAHEAPHTAHIVLVLWCRPPVASSSHLWWFIFCSRNSPFVSSIDCSVHEGDRRKLHLMNTAFFLNENNSSAKFGQVITKGAKLCKQDKHKRWTFARSEQGVDANRWMPGTNFLSIVFTLDINLCSTNPANLSIEYQTRTKGNPNTSKYRHKHIKTLLWANFQIEPIF